MTVTTVEPGFGGHSFMPEVMAKVKALRAKYPIKDIEVDGGLSPKTIDAATKAGSNMIVAGSSVFKAEKLEEFIATLSKSVEDNCLSKSYVYLRRQTQCAGAAATGTPSPPS